MKIHSKLLAAFLALLLAALPLQAFAFSDTAGIGRRRISAP